MNLVKTSILSAIATIIRMVTGFIITKVIAVYVGPSGLAVIGQLQNFINLVMLGAGNFLKTAVTKYTAEYEDDEIKTKKLWSASMRVVLGLNVITFIALFFFADGISNLILHSSEYNFALKIFAFSLPFFILNTIFLSILNGQRKIKQYTTINILLSIVSLLLVSFLSYVYGLKGALVAYVINQSVVFFITLVYLRKEPWLKVENFLHSVSKDDYSKLYRFALITFTSILASNVTIMFIRNYLIIEFSAQDAGYWQGIWALSQVALTLVTISLTTYLLPTLSKLKLKSEISKELRQAIQIVIPIVLIMSLAIYMLRDFIIPLLYTDDFMPMRELFLWQMLGNVIKVCGWLYGYVLVAKGMVKYTVATEVVFAITWAVLTILLVDLYGLVGATYAYAVNNSLHFFTMFYLYRNKIN
jgi:PST family polysaccharide transporter